MGLGSNLADERVATIQKPTARPSRPSQQAQGQTRPETAGRASSSRFRSSIRCTTSCCVTTWRRTASTRTPTCNPRHAAAGDGRQPARRQRRRLPRPDPFNQRAVYDEVGFIHILSKDIWDGTPAAPSAPATNSSARTQHLRGAVPRRAQRRRDGARTEEPRTDRQGDRAGAVPEPARGLVTQVLTGKFADGLAA